MIPGEDAARLKAEPRHRRTDIAQGRKTAGVLSFAVIRKYS